MVTPRSSYVPDRGDLIWITFDPQAGHEQAGRRPALVLSPQSYNAKAGLAVICPITNRTKGYSFEVPLPAGLSIGGVVLADHVKSLDWIARRAEFADDAPAAVVTEVARRLSLLIN